MEQKGLGFRLREVRKARGLTSDRVAELCHINAIYLRQIEGGTKIPSLPVFIDLCNALRVSPDSLLRDELTSNEVCQIREIQALWETASPGSRELALAMIRAALEHTNP